MAYQPIQNYGVIGDMHTAALVGMDGSIDWLCFPHFDSPSVFAAILDDQKGGRFKIAPVNAEACTSKQFYWPETNVLITRFLAPDGVGEITDFMPVGDVDPAHGHHDLIRRVSVARGTLRFELECRPAFNYARDLHETEIDAQGALFRTPQLQLALWTTLPLQRDGGAVRTSFSLNEGESVDFVLDQTHGTSRDEPPTVLGTPEERFRRTVAFWRSWLAQCTYTGRWREVVHRSALTLKLLTYEPTGAIVAAATTSLPEHMGGVRNWDYRYTWMRDASFTLYALLRVGFTGEATKFMQWLNDRCHEHRPDGSLQLMYGIDGRHALPEQTLDHLDGYRGSRPVRIGNGAFDQLQLDIYGELMDAVYLYNKYGSPISYELWGHLRKLLEWVCDHWRDTDEGIWEVRGGRQHFTYSKLMCWVALDRGLRLADKRSFPADRHRWLTVRDDIYQDIMSRGWSRERQAFVQAYGGDTLDASVLLMPLVFFMAPNDPRMLKTLDAVCLPPGHGGLLSNSQVYRYDTTRTDDGLPDGEGTFNICTFWLVEALTRAGKTDPARLEEARLIFERMLGYANHLGLYAEQTGASGEALGNFPQAFTHIALISAAFNLDRALGSRRGG